MKPSGLPGALPLRAECRASPTASHAPPAARSLQSQTQEARRLTYRGHIRNGAVVFDDDPADLPEGAAVEVSIVVQRPRIRSIEEFASKLPCDPFEGHDPVELLRELRGRPWRAAPHEPLE